MRTSFRPGSTTVGTVRPDTASSAVCCARRNSDTTTRSSAIPASWPASVSACSTPSGLRPRSCAGSPLTRCRAFSSEWPWRETISRRIPRQCLKPPCAPADRAGMELDSLLARAVALGASDIHLKVGRPPMLRIDGDVTPLDDHGELSDGDLEAVLRIVAPGRLDQFAAAGDVDLSYTADGLPRFRVNAFRQRGAVSFAFRVIPAEPPRFDDLGLPGGVRA